MKLLEYHKGRKTYILAAIAAICVGLHAAGILEIPNEVFAILGIGGAATMRAGISKNKK